MEHRRESNIEKSTAFSPSIIENYSWKELTKAAATITLATAGYFWLRTFSSLFSSGHKEEQQADNNDAQAIVTINQQYPTDDTSGSSLFVFTDFNTRSALSNLAMVATFRSNPQLSAGFFALGQLPSTEAQASPNIIDLDTIDGNNGFAFQGAGDSYFGSAVSIGTNVDSNNNSGILMLAPGESKAYLNLFAPGTQPTSGDFIAGTNVVIITNFFTSQNTNSKAARFIGDINHDGINDFALVGYGISTSKLFLVFGQAQWPTTIDLSIANNALFVQYELNYPNAYNAFTGPANYFNNGTNSFFVGTPGFDEGTNNIAGQLFLVHGRSSWTSGGDLDALPNVVTFNGTTGDNLGTDAITAPDFINNNMPGIFIGAADTDTVYHIYGDPNLSGTIDLRDTIAITLTNFDSGTAGETIVIRINRDHDDADDTATGDLQLHEVNIEWTE